MDCGATCLRMIASHYGKTVPISFLRNITSTDRSGTSFQGLSKGAEMLGFRTLAVKITLEQLRAEAPMPLIAHWNQNHFVVIYKTDAKKIYVADPANGLLIYSHEQFLQHWNVNGKGLVLLLEPTPALESFKLEGDEEAGNKTARSFLMHYIRPHRKVIAHILVSICAVSLLQLFVPFLTQSIVDVGILKKDISFIWLVLGAQLALTIGQLALELMRGWMILHMSNRINISLISDFLVKLMRLPIRYFDTRLTGDLIQRIYDHRRVENFLTNTTLSALFSAFTLVLYGIVLVWYSKALFFTFIIGSSLYILWILFFLKRRKNLDYKRFQRASETQSKIFELISGMQTIKLFNAEQQKRWGWERIQVKLFRLGLKSMALENVQSAGSRVINEVKNIFISVISASLVIEGQLTLGTMLAVAYIIGQLNTPILQMVGVIKSWQDAQISLERISEIHNKEDETNNNISPFEANRHQLPMPEDHSIYLKNVSFAYSQNSASVLKNISLEIPAGKVTAIVGSSGGGKSTLLKLLMRFYEPTSGEIAISNLELKSVALSNWRNACGVVMQEGFIFNDTVAGNIAVGEDFPDWDRLVQAAQLSNILSFIEELPLEFHTKIGPEGLGISGGQRQRILIARAIYKNPDILFFDEATSSLDSNNEREIMLNLEHFYKGKTVVIIAHRLSTVRHADKIIVLENGQIVEEGNHQDLSLLGGKYFHLVRNQLSI